MPFFTCMVASCKSNTKKISTKSNNEVVKGFPFPKDPVLRKTWLNLCQVRDPRLRVNRDVTMKVCVKHFTEDDFLDGMRARLLNLPPRLLKRNAVPSLHLSGEIKKKQEEILEKCSDKTKSKQVEVKDLNAPLSNSDITSKEYLSKLRPIAPKVSNNTPIATQQYTDLIQQCVNSLVEPKNPSTHQNELEKDNIIFKSKIRDLISNQTKLKRRIKELEAIIRMEKHDFAAKVKKVFANVLTPNQVDFVMGITLRPLWTDIEYTTAYTMQHFSKKAYYYLTDTLNYPLPGLSSLATWAARKSVKTTEDCVDDTKPLSKHMKMNVNNIKVDHENDKENEEICIVEGELPIGVEIKEQVEEKERKEFVFITEIKTKSKNKISDEDKVKKNYEECNIDVDGSHNDKDIMNEQINYKHKYDTVIRNFGEIKSIPVSDNDAEKWNRDYNDYVNVYEQNHSNKQNNEIVEQRTGYEEIVMNTNDHNVLTELEAVNFIIISNG